MSETSPWPVSYINVNTSCPWAILRITAWRRMGKWRKSPRTLSEWTLSLKGRIIPVNGPHIHSVWQLIQYTFDPTNLQNTQYFSLSVFKPSLSCPPLHNPHAVTTLRSALEQLTARCSRYRLRSFVSRNTTLILILPFEIISFAIFIYKIFILYFIHYAICNNFLLFENCFFNSISWNSFFRVSKLKFKKLLVTNSYSLHTEHNFFRNIIVTAGQYCETLGLIRWKRCEGKFTDNVLNTDGGNNDYCLFW
jgi:hypothetical protein